VVPNIAFKYRQVPGNPEQYGKGVVFNALDKRDFDRFNPGVLGLGDISRDGRYIQALAAFFDLEGFTDFCGQVDSHLVIPEFLTRYLHWLFQTLAEEFREGEVGDTVRLWGCLPFFAKFLGDGILFLWGTDECRGLPGKINIAQSLLAVTNSYVQTFLPKIRRAVSHPPGRLRCGIALGQIISIGGGADYVGSCINVASRLQKMGHLSFAVSRRGFDLDESPDTEGSLRSYLTLKRTTIRSIGSQELVYIRKDEFAALSSADQRDFSDP
jgi:class 3 adenylate cyclase